MTNILYTTELSFYFKNPGYTFPLWLWNGKSRAALPKITLSLPSNGLHESLYSLKCYLPLVVNNEQMRVP